VVLLESDERLSSQCTDMPAPLAPRATFDALFLELLPRLYRQAALLTGDGAQDAVHEAHLKLSAQPEHLTGHPTPYAYAFRTLVGAIRDSQRRRRRFRPVDRVTDAPQSRSTVELREAEWQVHWLLSQLTVKQAAAVILVDLDAYTIDEAADVLGVHRGTVSRARTRALTALRTLAEDTTP
jgi:RNA polymerase sigma factor (sigma-70 family)